MSARTVLLALAAYGCGSTAPAVTAQATRDAGIEAAALPDAGRSNCGEVPPGASGEIRPLQVAAGVGCERDPHALRGPRDAIELDDGTVLVTEMGAGRIARLSRGVWDVLATGLVTPIGLRALGDGSLVVTEEDAQRVSRLREGGRETVADGLGQVTYLTLDPQERVYVSSFTAFAPAGTIWQIAPDTPPRAFATGLNVPEGLQFQPDGALLAAEWNAPSRVLRLPPEGGAAAHAMTLTAGLSGIYGALRLPSGALLVAHHNLAGGGRGALLRVAENGAQERIVDGLKTPGGLWRTRGGDVLLTEFHGPGEVGYLLRLTGL